MKKVKHLPSSFLLFSILFLIVFKIIVYILIKNESLSVSFGGGNDADYYDAYAKGYINIAVNIWPVILRYLNEINLYSRSAISNLFLFLNVFLIPYIACRLSNLTFKNSRKNYLYMFLLISVYPSIYVYVLDIYRDVFMIFSFLIGCIAVKRCVESSGIFSFSSWFFISFLIGLFLLGLRPYLGYAFIISLFLWKIRFTKRRILLLSTLYLIALFTANFIGLFDVLTEYRAGFEDIDGGSNLGLDFSNSIMFIPNLILSFLGQMLGLYITNPLAIILLLVETAPFFFMLVYILKNIRWANNFVRFLIIFFVLYSSVWLIGNDNLGTAVRLRVYNYLAVYIGFFYILKVKKMSLDINKGVQA